MKTNRVCETVLAGVLALSAACPQVLADPPKTVPVVKAATSPLPAPSKAAPARVAKPVASAKPAAPAAKPGETSRASRH